MIPIREGALLYLPVNRKGRDWFVGDLHGELDMLKRFMSAVQFNPKKDRLIATGDLIDRGPQSAELLRYMHQNRDWFFSVAGNHEYMMVDAIAGDERSGRMWDSEGGRWIHKVHRDEWPELLRIAKSLPMAIQVSQPDGKQIGVIHADFEFDSWNEVIELNDIANSNPQGKGSPDLLWGRRSIQYAQRVVDQPKPIDMTKDVVDRTHCFLGPREGIDLVVAGHSPTETMKPLWVGNWLWIDTGCGYEWGCLSCCDIRGGHYVQIFPDAMADRRGTLESISIDGWGRP